MSVLKVRGIRHDAAASDAITISSTGAVDILGNLSSKGIDDNASATSLTIDSSGRMTTPYQPAFLAYFSNNVTVGSGVNTLTLDAKAFDVGNNFNTSTGRFTAPVSGQYLFTGNITIDTNTTTYTYISCEFHKNGNRHIHPGWTSKNAGGSGYYSNAVSSFVLNLAAGDTIALGIEISATGILVGNYATGCKLSGYLLG